MALKVADAAVTRPGSRLDAALRPRPPTLATAILVVSGLAVGRRRPSVAKTLAAEVVRPATPIRLTRAPFLGTVRAVTS